MRELGKEAMGRVYEPREPNLGRRVAIKTIKVVNLTAQETSSTVTQEVDSSDRDDFERFF